MAAISSKLNPSWTRIIIFVASIIERTVATCDRVVVAPVLLGPYAEDVADLLADLPDRAIPKWRRDPHICNVMIK